MARQIQRQSKEEYERCRQLLIAGRNYIRQSYIPERIPARHMYDLEREKIVKEMNHFFTYLHAFVKSPDDVIILCEEIKEAGCPALKHCVYLNDLCTATLNFYKSNKLHPGRKKSA